MFKTLFIVFTLVAATFSIQAGVNLKNGNFYVSYTDIDVPGGKPDLQIKRTYNSRSIGKGWFGFGWASEFETYLKTSADGSIVIHEHGLGARTRFTPKRSIKPEASVEKIIAAIKKKRTISATESKRLETKLLNNQELRHAYSVQYGVTSKVATGTTLYSGDRGGRQTLTIMKNGYKRVNSDGDHDVFDAEGKLSERVRKNGYVAEIKYKNNKVVSIKDTFGRQIYFEWHGSGFVKSVWSAGDKKVTYTYKADDLVEARDIQNNKYVYSYDKNHNLNRITYSDKRFKEISYSPKNYYVSSVKEKNGDITKYNYEVDPRNPELHYWVEVTKNGFDGKPYTNKFEYERRRRSDGSVYNHRIVTVLNGVKTETMYSECCSLPLKIARGRDITNFEYNSDGLLVKKTSTRGEFIQISYDEKLKKIKKVVNNEGWTSFAYDNKGNLTKAVSDQGRAVLLVYNSKGHITKMIDQNKGTKKRRTLAFEYNSQGKPVEITMSKVGKINVLYDNYGKILKVKSQQGPKMAFQVTQAFQNLLELIKPSGVSLSI